MRRVVVTGLGLVTPLGADVETVWKNLLAGKSGAGPITRFDTSDHKCKIACEVKPADHNPLAVLGSAPPGALCAHPELCYLKVNSQ